MVDSAVRRAKETLLEPVATTLRGIDPIVMTVVATGLGVAAGVAGWQQAYLPGLALFLLSKLADGLDGTLARMRNAQSDLGGYLDILSDTLIWGAVPLGLALGQPSTELLASLVLLLFGIYLNTASWMYLAAVMEKRQRGAQIGPGATTVNMPVGLMEGTETILVYCVFFLFPGALAPLFLGMAGLAVTTVLLRLFWAIRHL